MNIRLKAIQLQLIMINIMKMISHLVEIKLLKVQMPVHITWDWLMNSLKITVLILVT